MHHRFITPLFLLAFLLIVPTHTEAGTFSKKLSTVYKRYCALPLQYRILIPAVTIGACFCAYKYITTPVEKPVCVPVEKPVCVPVEKPAEVEFLTSLVQSTNRIAIHPGNKRGLYRVGAAHLIVHNRLNIVTAQTEAIVNAANGGIFGSLGVAKFIQDAVPDREPYDATVQQTLDYAVETLEYAQKANTKEKFPSGSAIIMPSYYNPSSPIKWIIHAVGPKSTEDNVPDRLYSAYFNSLRLAADKELTSITFPLLSSALFGVSNPNLDHHLNPIMPALRAMSDFFTQNPVTSIQEVHFTIFPAMNNKKTAIITDWYHIFTEALNASNRM